MLMSQHLLVRAGLILGVELVVTVELECCHGKKKNNYMNVENK